MSADKFFFLIHPYGSFPCKYRCVTFCTDCRLGRLYCGTTDQNLISQFTSVVREPHLLPRLFLAQALTTFFFLSPFFHIHRTPVWCIKQAPLFLVGSCSRSAAINCEKRPFIYLACSFLLVHFARSFCPCVSAWKPERCQYVFLQAHPRHVPPLWSLMKVAVGL